MQLPDGSFVINPDDKPWLPLGDPGNFMKVLHIDEEDRQVVFLQRFAKNTQHLQHTHYCTAVAYTLSGEWCYDGRPFPTHHVGFEPYGSTHIPETLHGNVADVLVILTSRDHRFIEARADDGTVIELDMEFFKTIKDMTVAEAEAFMAAQADATPESEQDTLVGA